MRRKKPVSYPNIKLVLDLKPLQIMTLTVLLGDKSYAAEILGIINDHSDKYYDSPSRLTELYKFLHKFDEDNLVKCLGKMPGNGQRNSHLALYYEITDLGKDVLHTLDTYRLKLSGKSLESEDETSHN